MKRIYFTLTTCLLLQGQSYAQDATTDTSAQKDVHTRLVFNHETTMATKNHTISKPVEDHTGRLEVNYGMVDLGINVLQDKTDYSSANVKSHMAIPAQYQNASFFDLRQGKSINVNIYPVTFRYTALKSKHQLIYISTGLGLQLYNFRYDNPVQYTKGSSTLSFLLDDRVVGPQPVYASLKKDKLGLDYLNVPLMATFQTRLSKKKWCWLVYGVGITEGYRIASWTKQVSEEYGKVKSHDAFGLADFNTCLTAEIGLKGIVRFYGSYQLTSLYKDAFDQHPVSFGLRFGGN